MKLGSRIHRWRFRRLALGLAIAAIVVPSAQAVVPPQPQANGLSTPSVQTTADRPVPPPEADTKASSQGNTPAVDFTQFAIDGPRSAPVTVATPTVDFTQFTIDGPRSAPVTVTTPTAAPVSNTGGFDWGDALIGGAIGLGLSLLLVAGIRARTHRRGELAGA